MKDLAKSLLANHVVILDTETTGLDSKSEIVQLAIVSSLGEVLLDTFIKPSVPIGDAVRIHGITERMVMNAPSFDEVFSQFAALVSNKEIAVYNAPYDARLLEQSTKQPDRKQFIRNLEWRDVMMPYAELWGDWSDYHGNYKWQKLGNACRQQGVTVKDAHNALGDCLMTLALLQKISG